MSDSVRHFGSARPFGEFAERYIKSGFKNPIPLPYKEKAPPPTGFTGHGAPDVTLADLSQWLEMNAKGNIGLRLNQVKIVEGQSLSPHPPGLYEIVGIDVDHHPDDTDDPKNGGAQLIYLENRLGKLPDTWISSARTNSIAGIRFYLVPAGLAWRGDCGKFGPDIDIISYGYRFCVVFPSVHPNGRQYLWFAPGHPPNGEIGQGFPTVEFLPLLPDSWIDFLTQNRTVYAIAPLDMDSTERELMVWSATQFAEKLTMCQRMDKAYSKKVAELEGSAKSHGILLNAHWEFLKLGGSEGHTGWATAVKEFEKRYREEVLSRGKRSATEANSEVMRSRIGALRRLKGNYDESGAGARWFGQCECYGSVEKTRITEDGSISDSWLKSVEILDNSDPSEFERNDHSQASHFIEVVGLNVRWLADFKEWVIYDGLTWHIDLHHNVTHLFQKGCMERTKLRGEELRKVAQQILDAGGSTSDVRFKQISKKAKLCEGIYATYSNVPKAKSALQRASEMPGVAMDFEQLNPDKHILALPGGKIARLSERRRGANNEESQGFSIELNSKEYYTTMLTAAQYISLREMRENPLLARQLEEWQATLVLVMPDAGYRRFVRKVLGYTLIGGNPEKKIIFLTGRPHTGKSTILNAVQIPLGDYAAPFNPANILNDPGGGPNPELADHFFRRVITASETGRARIDANMLKRCTGRDSVTVRRLYSNSQIKGFVHFKILLASNFPPAIVGEDKATRDRILVLPFENNVPPELDDKSATERIGFECKEAILLWLLAGYRDYVKEGLAEADWHSESITATRDFTNELSDVGSFLSDMCEIAPDNLRDLYSRPLACSVENDVKLIEWSQISGQRLHDVYKAWMGEGERTLGRRSFTNSVKGQGLSIQVRTRAGKSVRVWLGLKLKKDRLTDLYGTVRLSDEP